MIIVRFRMNFREAMKSPDVRDGFHAGFENQYLDSLAGLCDHLLDVTLN